MKRSFLATFVAMLYFSSTLVTNVEASPKLANPIISDDFSKKDAEAIRDTTSSVGVNFARKYTFVALDCGMYCYDGVIVNRETGQITKVPATASVNFSYRLDSTVLMVDVDYNIDDIDDDAVVSKLEPVFLSLKESVSFETIQPKSNESMDEIFKHYAIND